MWQVPTTLPMVLDTSKLTKARTKTSKYKILPLKLNKHFTDAIKNDEKNTNNETFIHYFGYQNPTFLIKFIKCD